MAQSARGISRQLVRCTSRRQSCLSGNPSGRTLFTSSLVSNHGQEPKAAHPKAHAGVRISRGGHVAEGAKEKEGPISGVPRSEEAHTAPLAQTPLPELFSLKNRTCIVTGAARGLGLTVARSLLEAGAHVHCLDMLPRPDADAWQEAEKTAQSQHLSITYHQVDVTSQQSLSSTFSQIFASSRPEAPVRGLYVAAGINQLKPALEYTPEDFRKVIDVNLTGTFFCAQAFAKEWFERNPGVDGTAGKGASIVLTGSMSGHVANAGLLCTAYNASKAGVNQLAKNLAMEWSVKGIRVNSVSPGYVRTALTAALLDAQPELDEIWHRKKLLGRLATPDEIRGPVAYLLSDASSFMTGADLLVDGGHCAT